MISPERKMKAGILSLSSFPTSAGGFAVDQHIRQRRMDSGIASSTKTTLIMAFDDDNNENEPDISGYASVLSRLDLALLDFISILLFAAVGKASHAPDGSIDFVAVLITAFPFVLSWFLITPLMGSYNRIATEDAIGSLTYTARGWSLAVPVGCALRGLIKGYIPPTSFVIVTMIATLVIIGGARALYVVAKDKISTLA